MEVERVKADRRPASPRGERGAKGETFRIGQGKLLTRSRVLAGVLCLFGGVVVVNAVILQDEKHPSPFFRSVAKAPETFPVPPMRPDAAARANATPAATTAATPVAAAKPAVADKGKPAEKIAAAATDVTEALLAEIQRELGKRGFYKGDADGKSGPATAQAIRDYQFSQRVAVDGKASETLLRDIQASKVTMKDELTDLLKRTAGAEDKPSRTVSDIQRALNKAGYGPLTADGQMGPSTKQALAKFEADKKLPPRGEPKGPVLKLLASASGIPISQ